MRVHKKYFSYEPAAETPCLESGSCLTPITIAYETSGELNRAKDNAILICHAFSGDSHVAGFYEDDLKQENPGWWDFMVGPGKGVDTDKYFDNMYIV